MFIKTKRLLVLGEWVDYYREKIIVEIVEKWKGQIVVEGRKMVAEKVVDESIDRNKKVEIWLFDNQELEKGQQKKINENDGLIKKGRVEEMIKTIDLIVVLGGKYKGETGEIARNAVEIGVELWAVPGRIDDNESRLANYLINDGARVMLKVSDLTASVMI